MRRFAQIKMTGVISIQYNNSTITKVKVCGDASMKYMKIYDD